MALDRCPRRLSVFRRGATTSCRRGQLRTRRGIARPERRNGKCKIKACLASWLRVCLHIGNRGDGDAGWRRNERFRAVWVSPVVSRSAEPAAVAVEARVSRGRSACGHDACAWTTLRVVHMPTGSATAAGRDGGGAVPPGLN